jgi:hypothetical protein
MPLQDAFHRYWDALAALNRARDGGGRDPDSGQTMDEAAEAYYAGLSATLNAFNAPRA